MMNFKEIVPVGSTFTMFNGLSFRNASDATLFEALPRELGYVQALFLSDITKEELDDLRDRNILFRYIKSKEGFVLVLSHFEGTDIFMELEFDPTLYEYNKAMQLVKSNNNIHFVAVESTTLKVRINRENKIPLKLLNLWSTSWEQAFTMKNFSMRYRSWVHDLQSRFETYELWMNAVPVGIIKKQEENHLFN